MAEVMDLRGEQVTLRWFDFKIGLPQLLEHAIQAGQMLLKSPAKHNNIIQVNQTSSPLQVCEDQVHQPLESTGCITKTKTQDIELKQPLACDESSLVAIFRIYFHLPIATHQIQGGKPTSMTKTIQGIVNSRKGLPGGKALLFHPKLFHKHVYCPRLMYVSAIPVFALLHFIPHLNVVSREGGGGFQHPFRIIPPPALDLTPNYGLATWGNNGIRLHGTSVDEPGGADIWPSVHAPSSFPVDKDSHAVCDDYSHTPNILSFAQHLAWVQEHVFDLVGETLPRGLRFGRRPNSPGIGFAGRRELSHCSWCLCCFGTTTAQTVLVVVVVFCLSWLPHHIVHLWVEFGSFPLNQASFVFRMVAHCLAYSNSSVNPIIYAFLSENFRNSYKQVFWCRVPSKYPKSGPRELRSRMEMAPSTNISATYKAHDSQTSKML
ncbi:hypothetical protein NQZ68_033524 [Dissostichus eleginoides]|nr:hypothetical protein NQZ68_033524 [Dissostichus eleginoides]